MSFVPLSERRRLSSTYKRLDDPQDPSSLFRVTPYVGIPSCYKLGWWDRREPLLAYLYNWSRLSDLSSDLSSDQQTGSVRWVHFVCKKIYISAVTCSRKEEKASLSEITAVSIWTSRDSLPWALNQCIAVAMGVFSGLAPTCGRC